MWKLFTLISAGVPCETKSNVAYNGLEYVRYFSFRIKYHFTYLFHVILCNLATIINLYVEIIRAQKQLYIVLILLK